ncbi:dephospho-CoA kinase [Bacteroides zoogleoformans]|uniref:Dephospho-CoA kinase n=1 Tax=Bacteroides zoogleoformans TaxID=28119 RepID=A0ABM6T5E1_9BACE|nr:dephospho-CoA kinase [Bacteroides zoogleoformans]AVM51952.1 dephospho-CoA kinase [Bacteroides zoogleoformans]TWJ13429.1 dephospho-CoA kinase [Bacteroides zoogleoformans]
MAIKIGITGGIGSGKSMVSHLLQVMGVPVYISDVEAKRLMCSDSFIRKKLQALLGKEIYCGSTLNKQLLASYLFADPEHARIINDIVHPCVRENFIQWVHHHSNAKIVGIESAILIEAGFTNEVDLIVMIYAPEELRISRAIRRDVSSRELIEKRIQSQMDDEKKREYADFVITNDDNTPLISQILNLIKSLYETTDCTSEK